MTNRKRKTVKIDPKDPSLRRKLWVRLNTSDGPRLFIIWSRVWKVAGILALVGWLGLAGAGWGFVKYKRGISDASFVDIAFFPLRHRHYRETLSTHYYTIAQKQLESGAWSKALISLRLAIANNANNLKARLQLADIYRQIQRPDFAIKLLEAGLKQGAEDIPYVRALFGLLQQANHNERIVALGMQLLPETPDQAPAHHEIVYQIAKAEIRHNQPDQAKDLLKKWKSDATLPGQLLLADIEVASGYTDLAVMRLEGLAKGRSNNEQVGLRLVSLYKDLGRLDDARRIAIQRMIKFPNSPGAHVDLISLLFDSKDLPAFESESANYITRHADDARAMVLLGSAAMRLKQPKLARMVRDHAPKNDEGHPAPVFQMIVMHAECLAGDYQKALDSTAELNLYQNLSPSDQAGATTIRVWANYGLGNITDAETELNQFLTLNTRELNMHGPMLAKQLDLLGKKIEARRVLLALAERNPDNPNHLTKLVSYDLERQSWDEVKSRLPGLLSLDPPPIELLTQIWHLQDVLQLSPDLRRRLANLVN